MAQAQGLRIPWGVRWRSFTDGVVVYVAETCETHLLPPDCSGLFASSALTAGLDTTNGADEADASAEVRRMSTRPSDPALQALIDLKIFDRVN
ncbi:MAG: hypothetical protein Q8M01_02955 [Rubrivivax sp.]|nr:hypothetical protein [Rubrivivax sp.]